MITPKQRRRAAALRAAADDLIPQVAENPVVVNAAVALIREWAPGTSDDPVTFEAKKSVRMYRGNPYMCCLTHTHHGEPNWDPEQYRTGWFQYHGTSVETARPYVQPLGAHDAYQKDEYVVENGKVYRCKVNATTWPPSTLPESWEVYG